MDLRRRSRRNVRGFYAWIGSMVLLLGSTYAANRLVSTGAAATRAAGVVVGTLGALPWLLVVAMMIRRSDEFAQRIHLIAIAIAAAAGLVMLIAIGWLVRAELMWPPDFAVVWLAAMVLWVAAMFGTRRFFEGPR
jgi:hypothetical protein